MYSKQTHDRLPPSGSPHPHEARVHPIVLQKPFFEFPASPEFQKVLPYPLIVLTDFPLVRDVDVRLAVVGHDYHGDGGLSDFNGRVLRKIILSSS